MQFSSTLQQSPLVSWEDAILQGLPPDNGLYMPTEIPVLPATFWARVQEMSFIEIAYEVSLAWLGDVIPANVLKDLMMAAYDFEDQVVNLDDDLAILELFHGPSMAFKDFGARFMAQVMTYFLDQRDTNLHILVATSGDTGGAVAKGFFGSKRVKVTILYPKGKVSDIQEKQLTTLGGNIAALEISGTFDDCQAMVKKAFLDQELRDLIPLASANSINMARLLPQAFYYISAYGKLKKIGKPLVFVVPSGNFGNLSAGILAEKMGMPVEGWVAATNANNVVPSYLHSGNFTPIQPSIPTISNAMDVGNPSNFPRLQALFNGNLQAMRSRIHGWGFSDEQTREAMQVIYQKYNYVVCPHTAVGWLGWKAYQESTQSNAFGVVLATAHYAKFLPEVEPTLQTQVAIPERLAQLLSLPKVADAMEPDYNLLKIWLLSTANRH